MVSCAAIGNRRAGRLPIGPQVASWPTCPTMPAALLDDISQGRAGAFAQTLKGAPFRGVVGSLNFVAFPASVSGTGYQTPKLPQLITGGFVACPRNVPKRPRNPLADFIFWNLVRDVNPKKGIGGTVRPGQRGGSTEGRTGALSPGAGGSMGFALFQDLALSAIVSRSDGASAAYPPANCLSTNGRIPPFL